ncbi:hypothetical protein ACP70R_042560 [Stipagrostis hirtigluma subsp. patula]
MLRLRNHLLPLLRAASPLPSALPRGRLLLSTSVSTSPAPFSLEDYLVAACGLAPAQARRVSKKAFDDLSKLYGKPYEEISRSRLHSASNPDAVLALLSSTGLSRADVAAVVSADPLLLRSSVKNMGPRLLALRDRLGLSDQQIARFLLVGSPALRLRGDIVCKLEFWVSFFGSLEQLLVALKRNPRILFASLERLVKPNIAHLGQCGLAVRVIAKLCSSNPAVIMSKPERVKEFVLRAEELGVPCSSPMFKYAVSVASWHSEEKVAAKLELLERTLGWSKDEITTVVSKQPLILGISEEYLLRKIHFLINEVGVEPQQIVKNPVLLMYSLEKRLVPRHRVMKVLQEKGLLKSDISIFILAYMGEKTFRLKFIDGYKDSVAGLADAYAAALSGGVPSEVRL